MPATSRVAVESSAPARAAGAAAMASGRAMQDATRIFQRHPANPLLKIADYPGIAQLFNSAPVYFENKILLLVSVIPFSADGVDGGETRLAESTDGVHFKLADQPFITLPDRFSFDTVNRHLIDNRVTKIDDTYYIVTPVMSRRYDGPSAVLGMTRDCRS